MSGDPHTVATAFGVSRVTIANGRENLFWAFARSMELIPIAVGDFRPSKRLPLSPMLAAAGAMEFSSVFVLANHLRLRRFKLNQLPTGEMGA